jgi:hypothetical protein
MYILLRVYYASALDFLDVIWDYTLRALNMSSPEQREYRHSALSFWKEVALMESEIPAEHSHNLILRASDNLLNLFFEIMTDVQPDDVDIEDPNETSTAGFATLAIAAFFLAAPGPVFHKFIAPTFDQKVLSDDWRIRHAALLLLYCLCPENSIGTISDDCRRFIYGHLNFVLEACKQRVIPRVTEAALFVLARILDVYKDVFRNTTCVYDPVFFIREIIDVVQIDPGSHPLISARYSLIIFSLASIWREILASYFSPLPRFFPVLMEILGRLLSRDLSNESEIQAYQYASDALNQVILNATDLNHHKTILCEIFSQSIIELESARELFAPNIRYVVQARLCSTLSAIADCLGEEIPQVLVGQSIHFLFALLHEANVLLYEEGLALFVALFRSAHSLFEDGQVIGLLQVVEFALQSKSPAVILVASDLLGLLYQFRGELLIGSFLKFFGIIEMLIQEQDGFRSSLPLLVLALAKMIESVKQENLVMELGDRVFSVMKMMRETRIDHHREGDVEFGNLLFEHLSTLFRVFAVLFCPDVSRELSQAALGQEKALLVEMSMLAKRIISLKNVNDFVLTQFVIMADEFAGRCSKRNTMILNRHTVRTVLDMTQESTRTATLRQRGKIVKEHLSEAGADKQSVNS